MQVFELRRELQTNGLRYVVNVIDNKQIVDGWRVRKVVVDGEELSDVSLTYIDAVKVKLDSDGTAVITTLKVRRE